MGELLSSEQPSISAQSIEGLGKITVLEALAEATEMVDISRSNASTVPAGDADDQ